MRRPLILLAAAAALGLVLVLPALAAAPTVTMTAPTSGSLTGATPTFAGNAGTASGDTDVTVNVYAGSDTAGALQEMLAPTGRDGSGNWSVTASPALAEGTHTAQAEQTNGADMGKSMPATTFYVDATAPTVALTAPTGGSLTNGTPTFGGAAGTVPASATASADQPTVTVNVYAGASASGTPVLIRTANGGSGAWSVAASPALPSGQYTAQAEQSDGAGNTGRSTAVTFNVDATGPAVSLTAPADGSATTDTTPAIFGGAGTTAATSTTSADSSTVFVKVYSGPTATGSPLATQTADGSTGSWVVTVAFAPGTYTVQAEQSDSFGNKGLSAPHTFTVDTSAPETTISSRTLSGGSATFAFTATEAASFECRLDGGAFSNCASPTTYSDLPLGSHTFEVRSIDGAGNVDQTSATSTWQVEAATSTPAAISTPAATPTPTPTPSIALLKPFPIVRMAGRITRSGVALTAFEVVATPGSRIEVRCSGRGCPTRLQSITVKFKSRSAKALARAADRVRLTRFRVLRAGLVIEIRITKPGTIGKYTRFRIRRGKLPSRSDACVTPGKTKPVRCPS